MNRIRALFEQKLFVRSLCACLAALGFAMDCLAYYPGFVSPDSLDQYTQAITNTYTNWHPPVMAAFWNLLLRLHPGQQGMFFFQLTLFWGSYYILQMVFIKHAFRLAFLVPLFFCAPFIQNFVGNIWKDIGLALSWLLALAILLNTFYEKRRMSKAEATATIILLSYGCWIRINALPGVVPLVTFWIYCLTPFEKRNMTLWQLVMKTLGVSLLMVLAQVLVTLLFIRPNKTYPEYKLFVHDLTGIYYKTGKLYFPDFITAHPGFDSAYIRKHYLYSTFDNIWWNNDGKQILPSPTPEQMNELQGTWIKAVLKNPAVYLTNRIHGFLNFLRITQSGSKLCVIYPYVHPNEFGLSFTPNRVTHGFIERIEKREHRPYMQPWFWIVLNLVVSFVAFVKPLARVKLVVLCLALSSLFYVLLEFIVFQADTEFRYFYWNCVAVSLSVMILLTEGLRCFYPSGRETA